MRPGLNDLLELIEASTAVEGIRWCLAANLDNLSAALSTNRPYFWATYGVVAQKKANTAGSTIDGWTDLDALNASDSLGLRLLDKLATGERHDLQTMLAHKQAFDSEAAAYANPLPAWMRYEAMASEPGNRAVTDPQDPGFIRAYWSFLKLRHLKPETPAQAEAVHAAVENAVTMLARLLRTNGQSRMHPAMDDAAVLCTPSSTAKSELSATAAMSTDWSNDRLKVEAFRCQLQQTARTITGR